MSGHLVDGLVLPLPIGRHPALDFCNTRAIWGSERPKEYLHSYEHLAVWAREAGLVSAGTARSVRHEGGERELARALAFRDALYAVCTGEGDETAWRGVAAEVERAAAAARLVRANGHGAWELPFELGVDLPLLAIARAAGALVASPALEQVGRCRGPGCGWLFLDPHGRRRWCEMAVCGNRAKARRHATRLRVSGGRA